MQYNKNDHSWISPHFLTLEFDCPCGACKYTLIDPDLVAKLEKLREALGCPIQINSGYRCSSHQAELRAQGLETSVGVSQHELGRAADISCYPALGSGGITLERVARSAGFRAVGVASRWIHVDLRDDKDRRWEYKS